MDATALPEVNCRPPAAPSAARTAKRSTNWLKLVRDVHLYTGVALSLALVVVGVTGVYLTHKDTWQWPKRIMVPASVLPAFYAGDTDKKPGEVSSLSLAEGALLAAGHGGVHLVEEGRVKRAPFELSGKVASLWSFAGHTAIGSSTGLYLHDHASGSIHRTLAAEPYDCARAPDGTLWLTLHHEGVRRSTDGGRSWSPTAQALEAVGGHEPGGRFHAHGIAVGGMQVLVATADGIFGTADVGQSWRPVGLQGQYVATVRSAVDASGTQWLLATTRKRDGQGDHALWASRDGGAAWSKILIPAADESQDAAKAEADADIRALAVSGSGDIALITRDAVYVGRVSEWQWKTVRATGADPVLAGPGKSRRSRPPQFRCAAFTPGGLMVGTDQGQVLRLAGEQLESVATLPAASAVPVSVGKLMEDLHTGKFFGHRLWIVYDATGAAIGMFVLSGFYLWLWPKWRSRQRRLAAKAAAPR